MDNEVTIVHQRKNNSLKAINILKIKYYEYVQKADFQTCCAHHDDVAVA